MYCPHCSNKIENSQVSFSATVKDIPAGTEAGTDIFTEEMSWMIGHRFDFMYLCDGMFECTEGRKFYFHESWLIFR